jgi:hypothetical protein
MRPAQLGADPGPSLRAKPACAVCFLGTLPSGPQHLADPTCQPHSFVGGKPLRTRPAITPPKLVPFLCCDTADRRQPNSYRWAVHPSPPRATRMTACPAATFSRCVDCGAPWHPIIAARLRLLLAALLTGEIPATPRAKVLHPSLCELSWHFFACRLACCHGRCATTMSTPSTRRQGLA